MNHKLEKNNQDFCTKKQLRLTANNSKMNNDQQIRQRKVFHRFFAVFYNFNHRRPIAQNHDSLNI